MRPNLNSFQAVLFDVDGTLIDSLYCITQGLLDTIHHYRGFRPEEAEIRQLVGMPLSRQMALYAEDSTKIDEMSVHAVKSMAAYLEKGEREFEAAVETLRHCSRNGVKTALVTSKNSTELADFLKRFEAKEYVDAMVCASDVSHPKPSPESAYLACELLGAEPTACAFVGDSIYDMRCGRGAGMVCIAVTYGAGAKSDLEAENPDLMFDSPEELLSWANAPSPLISCPERN